MNKVRGACGPCRVAHTACDGQRPCRRCSTLAKEEDCVDIERKRPGRPKGGKKAETMCLGTGMVTLTMSNSNKKPRLEGPVPSGPSGPIFTPGATSGQYVPTPASLGEHGHTPQSRYAKGIPSPPILPVPSPLKTATPSFASLSDGSAKYPLPPFPSTLASLSATTASSSSSSPSSSTSSSSSSLPSPLSSPSQPRIPVQTTGRPPILPQPLPKGGGSLRVENGSKSGRTDSHDGPRDLGKSGTNPYLESLLSFLVEEVKELKQSNAALRDDFKRTVKKLKSDISDMQGAYQRMEKDKRELEERLALFTSSSSQPSQQKQSEVSEQSSFATSSASTSHHLPRKTPSPSPPSSPLLPCSAPSTSPAVPATRADILANFPFLAPYNLISTPEVPFTVNDLSKPYLALRTMDSKGEENNPPMIVATNQAFCKLTNYSLHELLGCPLSKVLIPDERTKKQFLPFIYNRRPSPLISDIVSISTLCMPKEGKIFRLNTRSQIFYGDNGVMRWSVVAVEGIEEDVTVEMPLTWQPGLPKWWTAYSDLSTTAIPPLSTQPDRPTSASPSDTSLNAQPPLNDDNKRQHNNGAQTSTSSGGDPQHSYDLGDILSNFAAPLPSAPVSAPDFAWLLRDGVGSGLGYAASREHLARDSQKDMVPCAQTTQPTPTQMRWGQSPSSQIALRKQSKNQ